MVVVRGGSYWMGSPGEEMGRDDDEGPRHQVRIPEAFAVGQYEVTVAEYGAFVRETVHDTGGCWYWDLEEGKAKRDTGRSWREPGFRQTGRDPVVCVSWEDAKAYVGWLRGKTGKGYRLLSEAEWEYVARAGTGTRRYWGDDQAEYELCRNANGAGTETSFRRRATVCGDGHEATSPVGKFGANGWGLYDVLGNAWEWVEDCWHDSYSGAPADGSAWVSGGDCGRRVLRGGSWVNNPRNLRSANRHWYSAGSRVDAFGFRIARTLTP